MRPLQRDLFGRPGGRMPAYTQALTVAPGVRAVRGARRHWRAAGVVVCLSAGAAAAALWCVQPVYRASEAVEAQDLPAAVRFAGAAPAVVHTSPAGVQSLAEELGARQLVALAVRRMPAGERPALALRPLRHPRWLAAALRALRPPRTPAAAAMRQLQVAALNGSRLIRLRFAANQPALAADFLRALTLAELQRSAARRRRNGDLRVAAIARQAQRAQARAEAAEAALEALAARSGLPDPAARLALAARRWQQLAAAQTAAALAATRRAAALAAGALPVTSATPAGAPPPPAGLELRRAEQAAAVARLAALYRPQAAPLVQARRQLASLDASLLALRQRAQADLRRSLAAARAQAEALRAAVRRQAAAQAGLRGQAAAFALAQRRLQARQDAYAALLQQLAQATAETDAAPPPLRVVDAARTARRPVWPRPAPAAAEALLLGCLLAAAAVWGLERWDDGLRLPEAAELGVPLLTVLPRPTPAVTGPHAGGAPLEPWAKSAREGCETPKGGPPPPAFVRGLETAAASLLRARGETGANVLLVTSAEPGAGSAALAWALAQRLAEAAPGVLLLDAQADDPALPLDPGGELRPGLAELLAGACSVEQALRPAPAGGGGLAWIAAGRLNARGLLAPLASGEAAALLAAAAARHAWVIVNGPPVEAGPEAGLWAALTDGTLVTAVCGRSSRRRVRRALDALEQAGAAGLALVLNRARECDTAAVVAAARLLPERRGDDALAMRQRA